MYLTAPRATTSSGLTVTFGSFPVIFLTNSCTAGIRVEPPTRMTSSKSLKASFASLREFCTGVFSLRAKAVLERPECYTKKVKTYVHDWSGSCNSKKT
ncbi:hypothetical protein V2J09_013210 [Rumex salicifolius]